MEPEGSSFDSVPSLKSSSKPIGAARPGPTMPTMAPILTGYVARWPKTQAGWLVWTSVPPTTGVRAKEEASTPASSRWAYMEAMRAEWTMSVEY